MNQPITHIHYSERCTRYSRVNRKNPTNAEDIARKKLFRYRPFGYKFTRQKPLGPYIADFYSSKLRLVIEIDGGYHLQTIEYDKNRDNYLAELGITTARFTNEQVIKDIERIRNRLGNLIKTRGLCEGA